MIKPFARTTIVFSFAILIIGVYFVYEQVRERRFIADVQQSYHQALSWLRSNQKENGLFYYIYQPSDGVYPNSNNAVRQLMASRLVAELAQEDASWQEIHEKNLNFLLTYWYKVDTTDEGEQIGYVLYDNKSKLGANAMLLRTLVASPRFDEFRTEATQVFNGILELQRPDGSFVPWYKEPDYAFDAEYLLTFYSGEALVALIEYYEKTGDPRALEAAITSQNFYLTRYVQELEHYYYPAYVPWHTVSLYTLYHITGDPRYAEAVFILTDKLLELQDTTTHNGRFYNPKTPQYGSPHSSSDAVYTEGLAYAHDLAHEVNQLRRSYRYHVALERAVTNLRSLQYTQETIGREPEPWRLLGALRYHTDDARIRVDTTQHAMDAYRIILKTFDIL